MKEIGFGKKELEVLIDSLPEGIFIVDKERKVIMANKKGIKYLSEFAEVKVGEKISQIGGFSLEEIIRIKYSPSLKLSSKTSSAVFEIFVQPLKGKGHLFFIKDITREKDIQIKTELQNRLAAIGGLATGIAHDFNNILMSIMGFAEIIRDEEVLSLSGKENIKSIITQVRRASRLIKQLLDFGRKTILEPKPLELTSFFKGMLDIFKRTLPENIKYKFVHEPGDYWVNADPLELQQVMLNLAMNSKDAMPEGGEIIIKMEKFEFEKEKDAPYPGMKPGEWIKINFQDTGTGIPEKILPRIFEPFFTTKSTHEGTGLGLAQVYGIVSQHCGFIDVKSKVGEGTTFIIYLPSLKIKELEEEKVEITTEIKEWRILLVEDESYVREVMEKMLKKMGCEVFSASTGKEALRIYQEKCKNVSLVISDMILPDIKGIEIFKILKRERRDLKFLLITGYPIESEKEIIKLGITEWVHKPIDFEQLKKAINRILKSS